MAYPHLSPGARLLAVKLKDNDGNLLGEVKEWMMDVEEGRVVYVLASLKDSPNDYIALPWQALYPDKSSGGYRVKGLPERVLHAPRISTDALKELATNTGFLDQVYQHFEASPYWTGDPVPRLATQGSSAPSGFLTNASEKRQPSREEASPQTNDLKERRDKEAGNSANPTGGLTNVEHGLASGYGGVPPEEKPSS